MKKDKGIEIVGYVQGQDNKKAIRVVIEALVEADIHPNFEISLALVDYFIFINNKFRTTDEAYLDFNKVDKK